MAEELAELRKAGKRFCLALVDPLLKKPAYFELRKPEVTVGFLPGCDWVLPWSSMGIDIVAASRQYDVECPWNDCRRVCHSSAVCAPEIGKREKEPLFTLKFDAREGWFAECDVDRCCQVLVCTASDRVLLWSREFYEEVDAECEASGIGELQNGSVFAFAWPYSGLRSSYDGYGMPVQQLRFTFVACDKDEYPEVHHLRPGPPHLLSLPKEVLAKIASFLDPREFLATLGMVGRVFTSPALEGLIPWKTLNLNGSFDSYRIVQLAKSDAVEHVTCEGVSSPELRGPFYMKWRRVINQENLTLLDIEDPGLLHVIGVPPNLRELRIRIVVPRGGFWSAFKLVQFPPSVRRLCIHSGRGRENAGHVDPLCPKWLFSAFLGLEELHLTGVKWGAGWNEVPLESLTKIRSIYSRKNHVSDGDLPYSSMPNLRFLRCDGFNRDFVDGTIGLPCLEYLVLGEKCFSFSLRHAPNLRFLHVMNSNYSCIAQVGDFCPRLEFLYVKASNMSPRYLGAVLESLPQLKHAEISGSNRQTDCVDESWLPQRPGVFFNCTWYDGSSEPMYVLTYSCVANEDRQKAMAPLNRETFLWVKLGESEQSIFSDS